MSGYVEDLGELPLDSKDHLAHTDGVNLDAADNGVVPRGMEVRHEDDDEGGEGGADGNLDRDEGRDDLAERRTEQGARDGEAAADEDGEEGADEEGGDEDEEEDEEEEDEDDEDDDDDDDGDGDEGEERRPRKKAKKRRFRGNKYVDIEVEVDEDEEDEDEEGEAGFEANEDYLARPGEAGAAGARRLVPIADSFADEEDEDAHDDRDHRQLERRNRDKEEQEAMRIAREYKERHRQRRGAGGSGIQAMQDFAPRSVLMPGVNDPSIWSIRCKIGRERELVMSISRKALMTNLAITSAFQRDSFQGRLYIEARSEAHVKLATEGLIGIYGATAPHLVPIEEMPDLLKSRKKETALAVGGWVRIKRGTYKGDLAQIDDVPEGTEMLTLKVVPRIDLNPREELDDGQGANGAFGRKRRRPAENSLFRPPAKFFNADEVRTAYAGKAKIIKDAEGFHFQNDIYANGYLIKDFRLTAIEKENINPTIDEITRFIGETAVTSSAAAASGDGVSTSDGVSGMGESKLDLNLISDAAKQQTILQPGDYVEIFEGSQKGIIGTIASITANILIVSPDEPEDLIGTKIEVLATQVRKKFKAGDHVKVLRGKNVNESGLVLKVKDDLVTFLSDLSVQEVTVFSKDIREAAEVGTGASSAGQFELHDLVQLDGDSTGVIFKIDPDTFRILDQMGTVRLMRPSQVKNKVDTRRFVAIDHEGYELRSGDLVKEVGQLTREPRQGRVLHVWKSLYAFLHNRDIVENGGVFVAYARSVGSVAPRSTKLPTDLSKMNPEVAGGAALASGMMDPNAGAAPRGQREFAIGLHVTVIRGNHKGYKGIVKDLNGPLARVELHTRSSTITIERDKLGTMGQDGKMLSLADWELARASRRTGSGTPYAGNSNATPLSSRGSGRGRGGFTPSYGGMSNSPSSVYSSGKTPMYNRGGATPFGGGFGGATPSHAGAFAAGSATPYMSGRTPAYGGGGDPFAASSRTPYTASGGSFNAGSRTPQAGGSGGSAWGSATPTYGGAASRSSAAVVAANNAWGSSSPAYQAGGGAGRGAAAWGSESPRHQPQASSNGSAWGSVEPSAPRAAPAATWDSIEPTAPTPAADAWGSTSPAYVPHKSGSAAWASVDAPTPYVSAPTPAAPTPYATAPTPAAGGGGDWDYDTAPTPAASAPTPYASANTPAPNDAWD